MFCEILLLLYSDVEKFSGNCFGSLQWYKQMICEIFVVLYSDVD